MSALTFPCTIFKTKNRMNDYGAKDMRCGDLSEAQLTGRFNLREISRRVDPYKLTELADVPYGMLSLPKMMPGKKITKQACIRRLFDELRFESNNIFTCFGRYDNLILDLINHMQYKNGGNYRSSELNDEIRKRILDDSTRNSTLSKIKDALTQNLDWERQLLPTEGKKDLYDAIMSGVLPKFTGYRDWFNGFGVSVHDTYATHITINSLSFDDKENFTAMVQYKIQDHFGLDDNDILNFRPRQFRFFRIWFLLQRYDKFAIKPFFNNMEATITIRGNIRDRKTKRK